MVVLGTGSNISLVEEKSEAINTMEAEEEIYTVGVMYSLETREVEFFNEPLI